VKTISSLVRRKNRSGKKRETCRRGQRRTVNSDGSSFKKDHSKDKREVRGHKGPQLAVASKWNH